MSQLVKFLLALILALPVNYAFAGGEHEENPCGNHGNHCCTDDGGQTFVAVDQECSAFCESTAVAVAVAVSECGAYCAQDCGEQIALAASSCAQTCSNVCVDKECAEWRVRRNRFGQVKYKICLRPL